MNCLRTSSGAGFEINRCNKVKGILGFLSTFLITANLFGQTFTKITDANNPIVTFTPPSNFSGCAWVDYDSDGDLDLFATDSSLFRNEGAGTFVSVSTALGGNQNSQLGRGVSWGDYDNDGDPDCFMAGFPSTLYRNDGGDSFTAITSSAIDLPNHRGWACSWGDYNNDGFLDIVIAHPRGFLGASRPSFLFRSNRDGTFIEITSFEFNQLLKPYTVPTWSDYDDDGDLDLFFASGPGGSAGLDNLYENRLSETGEADFQRIATPPIATDFQDGQTWNWIDYDNDGDLDAFLTNWSGAANRLYRNDNGSYVRINNIMTGNEAALANNWGDLDNDGDLDCIVTNNGGSTHYYENNGDGTFSSITNAIVETGNHRGATLGDYDNDGDLDLFINGSGQAKALFRNDAANENGWINITCVGTESNRSAIGTKVRAKATVSGSPVWQRREISAQNSFNSHNSLRVHFGFGDATVIDSLMFDWPSGNMDVFTDVQLNQFMTVTEGDMPTSVEPDRPAAPNNFKLSQNYPNPFNAGTNVIYELFERTNVVLTIYNLIGEKITTLVDEVQEPGKKVVRWNGTDQQGSDVAAGLYVYEIKAGSFVQTKKMTLLK